MFFLKEWFQADRSKHTAEWFNDILRLIRWNMRPLISPDEAQLGMNYLLSNQDMTFIERLFQNQTRLNIVNANPGYGNAGSGFGRGPQTQQNNGKGKGNDVFQREMQGLYFQPQPVMEKIRNILVSEQKKMGAVTNVRANDPTSSEDRKNDKALIKNHREIEGFLHYVYTSIGQQPYSLANHESRFGEKPDKGNTQAFHAMGMNPDDPSDVAFFFQTFHKLDQEIAAQSIIDYVLSYNQIMDKTENWVNDIMAKKAVAAKIYVSEVNGAPTIEYVAPECVFIYGGGNRKDYNDANAKVIEKRVTVRQLIDTVGNSFDIEKEWNNLLVAISFTSGVEFTAIHPSYRNWCSGMNGDTTGNSTNQLADKSGTVYGYNQFMDFKVTLGYVEATSQIENYKDPTVKDDGTFYQNNQPGDGQKYANKSRYETPTYKSYYLAVSAVDQVLFSFGPMAYQDIEGYNDWNTNFTIITWKEIGLPIAITCRPLVDLINEAWYKFKYEVRRAKPRGTDYNYDSLITIAMDMFADEEGTKANKIDKLVQMLDQQPDGMWTFPVIDGKVVTLTNNQLNIDKPNGMSDKAMEWWKIFVEGIAELYEMLGIASLRQGDPGNARDSMNNQFKALEYSISATYYIPDMLTYLYQQLAVRAVYYTQDIVTYKDYQTVPYKFLEKAVGKDVLDKIESLGKTALHRFGIFVESLNQAPLRAKLDAVLLEAVKTKAITTSEWLLIQDFKSPKKAFEVFAYFEQRNRKLAQKQAMELQQQAQQAAMQLEQMKQKTVMIDGDNKIQVAQIQANAQIQNHLINQKGGLDKQAMKDSNAVDQIYHQARADIAAEQANVNNGGKTTPAPLAPPQQGNPLAAQPGNPPSGAQQLREAAQPQSSQVAMQ